MGLIDYDEFKSRILEGIIAKAVFVQDTVSIYLLLVFAQEVDIEGLELPLVVDFGPIARGGRAFKLLINEGLSVAWGGRGSPAL